jgi:hypothetical protein
MVKLQRAINHLESTRTFKNHNELFEAVAATKWGVAEGFTSSFIYRKIQESLDTDTPIRMKTKAGRIRKGGMSELTSLPRPGEETGPKNWSYASEPRPGETENQELIRLRDEIEALRLKFSVYYRDGDRQIFKTNPYSVVRCAANAHPTKVKTCPEADPHYEAMLDGLVAAQKLMATYTDYAENQALNPDDRRRVKEATDVLNAFFKATRISRVELTKRQAK